MKSRTDLLKRTGLREPELKEPDLREIIALVQSIREKATNVLLEAEDLIDEIRRREAALSNAQSPPVGPGRFRNRVLRAIRRGTAR